MNLSPLPVQKFFGNNGRPLVGGLLFTYAAGTSTKIPTYTDESGSQENTNPIDLDFRGEANVWLDPELTYKFVLAPRGDTDPPTNPIWSVDDIAAPITAAGIIALLTQQFLGEILWPRTAAEISAGVTPTNFYIPSHSAVGYVLPERYGTNTTPGTTDMTSAVQNALLVAAQCRNPVFIGMSGRTRVTANLNVPVGIDDAVDIEGASWTTGGLYFDGAAVTTGLTFSGSSYSYCGEVRNLRVYCVNGAARAITFNDLNHPRVTRCALHGAAGAGVMFNTTLMSELNHTLVISCGSATEASVEVDGVSTTFQWSHSRISDGNATQGGLRIDRTFDVSMIGGAIESSGIPLRIGSKTESSRGCVGGLIYGVDLENPGNNNYYIDLGAGLSGSARVQAWDVRASIGSPSGTTTVTHAVRMNQCSGIRFGSNNWSVPNGVSAHELTSTANLGISIEPHRQLFDASGIPWVRRNGAQVKAAGTQVEWNSDSVLRGLDPSSLSALSGATPSILVSATQGGYYRRVAMVNGGATTVTALTGGENGMEILLTATNGNTTLTHSTTNADQFRTKAGVNLVMVGGEYYSFVHNGNLWVQL